VEGSATPGPNLHTHHDEMNDESDTNYRSPDMSDAQQVKTEIPVSHDCLVSFVSKAGEYKAYSSSVYTLNGTCRIHDGFD
jgi:hypothetical protein